MGMSLHYVILFYSLLAGLLSILLLIFSVFLEKDDKKSKWFLVWSVIFLGVCFGLSEYALWVQGIDLFSLVLSPNIPLLAFFGAWFSFLIWLFERRGERKLWVLFLVVLIVLIVIAVNCMNCLHW